MGWTNDERYGIPIGKNHCNGFPSEGGISRVLWKKIKKEATHLKHFPEFSMLQQEVDRALLHFAQTPHEITVLMARYCETLGAKAA